MAFKICECGFANNENAEQCVACGAPLGTSCPEPSAKTLTLFQENGSNHAVITIPAPGGIIGRAGDFAPEVFSERVSGIHANISASDACWEIEHLGRNRSAILRAGEWIELPKGRKVGLLDGDRLRLADMLFRVSLSSSTIEEGMCTAESECGCAEEEAHDGAAAKWVVICPVCGSVYEVENELSRIETCQNCADALDRRKIASARAQRETTK